MILKVAYLEVPLGTSKWCNPENIVPGLIIYMVVVDIYKKYEYNLKWSGGKHWLILYGMTHIDIKSIQTNITSKGEIDKKANK